MKKTNTQNRYSTLAFLSLESMALSPLSIEFAQNIRGGFSIGFTYFIQKHWVHIALTGLVAVPLLFFKNKIISLGRKHFCTPALEAQNVSISKENFASSNIQENSLSTYNSKTPKKYQIHCGKVSPSWYYNPYNTPSLCKTGNGISSYIVGRNINVEDIVEKHGLSNMEKVDVEQHPIVKDALAKRYDEAIRLYALNRNQKYTFA